MRAEELPDSLLTKMRPNDRKKLGLKTSAEAQDAFVVRSEKELQKQIASYLSLHGIWYFTSRMDRKTGNVIGTPDFLCVVNSRPLALEAKFGDNKLTDGQKSCHAAMRKNGWIVAEIRSLPEVKALVDYLESTRV